VILETERLQLREMDSAIDAEFIFTLLNSPKFLAYIGDRCVRSVEEATAFIESRYRSSYRDHGFGLYTVEIKEDEAQVGVCGFVKRDSLTEPDLGFAFLPEHESKGYGFEAAYAMLDYGRDTLRFGNVFAITSTNNDISGKLLRKLGFEYNGVVESDGETLKLFFKNL
jgi:RimJ/RimL family protein N-acetyltransferase